MTPNITERERELSEDRNFEKLIAPQAAPRKYQYVYYNIFFIGSMHIAAIYGLFNSLLSSSCYTVFFTFIIMITTELGITAGAHRLWTHKSYKAKLPLQLVLMLFQSMSLQGTGIEWARDHRMHHKYSDTDADPYNATRGLFYSHFGWIFVRKHPEVIKRGKDVDISDLKSNPVLMFQQKYSLLLQNTLTLLLPTIIPVYLWGESLSVAWHMNAIRFTINLNMICLVNSVAHVWGYRPYDSNIYPVENAFVSAISLGEGFHNYHHVFPWDYRAAELNNNYMNLTTKFIDFCAWMGWAYDLKTVSEDMILARSKRTGDGSPTKIEEEMIHGKNIRFEDQNVDYKYKTN